MDKLKDREKDGERAEGYGTGGAGRLKQTLAELSSSQDKSTLLRGLLLFTLGVIFARCHVVFDARPLGIVLTALLSEGVWIAGLGTVLGSLTLGADGIILGVAILITVFLRVIISGGRGEHTLFGESVGARMAVSVIGGFVVSAYDILLSGLNITSVVFGAAMILTPPLILFLLSGLFSTGIDVKDLFSGNKNVLSLSRKSETEKMNTVFFGLSALTLLFFVTLSLSEYTLVGISSSYIFTAFVTLLVAKRMGALKAAVVGFIAPLGVSGIYSVSFALAGLGAGLLFSFGTVYAMVAGGALLSAWSAYCGGLSGFVSTLPEYLIAAALSSPLCKTISAEKTPTEEAAVTQSAKDMVGTVALKYQNSRYKSLDSLEVSLASLATLIRSYSAAHLPLSAEEYKNLVIDIAEGYCSGCQGRELCNEEYIKPCINNAEKIAEKLLRGETVMAEDVNGDTEFCQHAEEIAAAIMREAARAERENHRLKSSDATAEEYELIARLISEARQNDCAERAPADELTEPLCEVARNFGFEDGIIRAFGARRRHFILAGEDEGGEWISSKELRLGIEAASGVKLGVPEYFRHGKMALMECEARRAYAVECASGKIAGDEKEISGDSIAMFEAADDRFYAVMSDGMGRGEIAKDTSEFVVGFLERALDFGASKDTVLHLLNHAMRRRSEECSATVDLFEMDLITGEATFVKSGSAPSFVKRDSSIFRIKSQTAPIGLMKSIDSERIRVEIKSGDYVVMLSDGILQSAEESPWLLELLSSPPKENLKEYADFILTAAAKNSRSRDDMSVIVARVIRV